MSKELKKTATKIHALFISMFDFVLTGDALIRRLFFMLI